MFSALRKCIDRARTVNRILTYPSELVLRWQRSAIVGPARLGHSCTSALNEVRRLLPDECLKYMSRVVTYIIIFWG